MAATPHVETGLALRLERTYPAPPERVFDAWVHPDAVARWFAPSADYEAVVTALDARPGGRYRVEMRHRGGNVHVVTGVYHEVSRPTKLVMTWAWEGGMGFSDTRVTVELTPLDAGTRLVLHHEQFPNDLARGEHEKGWTGCLERLGSVLD
jgi:glutathione S-transferase